MTTDPESIQILDDVWKHLVTTKAMRNGTGLGLAVVRTRVHGGVVTLQSWQERWFALSCRR